VDLLLEACASLAEPVELWIVGDGPARSDLESLARRVLPTAEFHGDQRGPALESLFDRADLFVLPGTGGLAVQQALAHGLPVIVARGDGTQQDMVTPENGWLVADGDRTGLEAAIATALSDRTRLEAMGRVSRRLADSQFNLEAMVEAFLVAVNSVAGEGG
jgi:glycosyltransferase involved in cell wall biosynthesis